MYACGTSTGGGLDWELESHELKVSMSYMVRACLKKQMGIQFSDRVLAYSLGRAQPSPMKPNDQNQNNKKEQET